MIWHDGWGAGGWLMMSVLMLIFWALVVAGLIWPVRHPVGAAAVHRGR